VQMPHEKASFLLLTVDISFVCLSSLIDGACICQKNVSMNSVCYCGLSGAFPLELMFKMSTTKFDATQNSLT